MNNRFLVSWRDNALRTPQQVDRALHPMRTVPTKKKSKRMNELRLVLLGFGSANRALVKMLLDKSEVHKNRTCIRIDQARFIPWKIVCIVTARHGKVCILAESDAYQNEEVNAEDALKTYERGEMLDDSLIIDADGNSVCKMRHVEDTSGSDTSKDRTIQLLRNLAKSNKANIVVEAIPSNPRYGCGEPAVSFILEALQAGMHVVSANKGPLAHQQNGEEVYWNLQQIASRNNVQYLHESAVMDGVPIFSLWQRTLPNATLTKLRGCLNSTTTMILTRMEGDDGETFDEALAKAKEMGIVEADESLDIDGYDAAVKLRALLVVFSNQSEDANIFIPSIDDISRDSIRCMTKEDIRIAYEEGAKKYRLVATAELLDVPNTNNKEWKARVQLEKVSPSDPIYNLTGTSSSVQFHTDVLGPITMVSTDPTLVDTSYGLFADIIRVASSY